MPFKFNPFTGEMDAVNSPLSIGSSITSGTANSVLFIGDGGVISQDNAAFYWDDTNHYLGLGTNTPRGALDLHVAASFTIGDPTGSGTITFDYTAPEGFQAFGATFEYWVHAYKDTVGGRVYSATPLVVTGTDDASELFYSVQFSWNPVAGADGYRVRVINEPATDSDANYFDTTFTNANLVFQTDTVSGTSYVPATAVITPSPLAYNPIDLYVDASGNIISTKGATFTGDINTSGFFVGALKPGFSNYYVPFTDSSGALISDSHFTYNPSIGASGLLTVAGFTLQTTGGTTRLNTSGAFEITSAYAVQIFGGVGGSPYVSQGGQINVIAGTGAAQASPGDGGPVLFNAGTGGAKTSGNGSAGNGGNTTFASGSGGASQGSGGGTNTGGNGGYLRFQAGSGGTALTATTLAGGAGGDTVFYSGQGGTVSVGAGGHSGNIYFSPGTPGLGTSTGATGNLYFGWDKDNAVARGLIGFGTNSVSGALVTMLNGTAANVGLLVKGAASQSGNLQEYQKSDGTLYSAVDSIGRVVLAKNAGTPTGTPATGTCVYDTTNNKLYVYNSGWKSVTLS